MKSICVFCGSSSGRNFKYLIAAQKLGKILCENNIRLIYGGGNIGLMGELANSVLKYNGEVTGVIPADLIAREVALLDIQDLKVVDTMHERKQLMSDLADGFIAMPGGLGTLEEFFEIWTWAQLGIHSKPIGLLNIENYYDEMITFFNKAVNEEFISGVNREMIIIDKDPSILIFKMQNYNPPAVRKWISKDES
jgi:uncharacterized protein (TIGR00730 family)